MHLPFRPHIRHFTMFPERLIFIHPHATTRPTAIRNRRTSRRSACSATLEANDEERILRIDCVLVDGRQLGARSDYFGAACQTIVAAPACSGFSRVTC